MKTFSLRASLLRNIYLSLYHLIFSILYITTEPCGQTVYSYTPHYNSVSTSHTPSPTFSPVRVLPGYIGGQIHPHFTVRIRVSSFTKPTGPRDEAYFNGYHCPTYGVTPWQESNILGKRHHTPYCRSFSRLHK